MAPTPRLRPLAIATAAVALCAALIAMFYAGRGQRSAILVGLFTLWVASPFAAAIWANIVSRRWPARVQAVLSYAALLVSIASAAFYLYAAFAPAHWKAGFVFLVGPFLSWIALAVAAGAVAAGSRA